MRLSVVILTCNEEKNISNCIRSVSFADEIVVIDDMSEDDTVGIAKKLGAHIYPRKLDDFSSQRNYGLARTTGDWVLFLDADERISEQLQNEIRLVVSKP